MYFSNLKLLAFLASVGSAMALPTTTLNKRFGVAPNTQSCTAADHVFWTSFSIDIGVDYAGGRGCNDVYNALSDLLISNWQCVDDGSGGTQLWFNCSQLCVAAGLNQKLESMYPMVNGFNCPPS